MRILLSLNDRKVDLISEGIDLSIRAGKVADSSLISRAIAPDRRVICGSPRYWKRHGTPRVPADLTRHECLKHSLMATAQGWTLRTSDGPLTVPVSGRLEIDSAPGRGTTIAVSLPRATETPIEWEPLRAAS